MSISFNVSNNGTITAMIGTKPYQIDSCHPNYENIKKAMVAGDEAKFELLCDIPKAMETFSKGKVEIKDGQVYYNGQVVSNMLSEKILSLMNAGFTIDRFVKFMERVEQNPSMRSRNQLFPYIELYGLPITEDGCFLSYKRVRDDFHDIHSGTVRYAIGDTPNMDRSKVDDDPLSACSAGLHAGALKYVENFGSGGHVMIVKMFPEHVVSVPHDASHAKIRCCYMEVVGEYTEALTAVAYTNEGQVATPDKASIAVEQCASHLCSCFDGTHLMVGDYVTYKGFCCEIEALGPNNIVLLDNGEMVNASETHWDESANNDDDDDYEDCPDCDDCDDDDDDDDDCDW